MPYRVSTHGTHDIKPEIFVLKSYASIGQILTFLVVYFSCENLLNSHYSRICIHLDGNINDQYVIIIAIKSVDNDCSGQ